MNHSPTPKAKRGAFATLAFLAAPALLWAQVSLYQFSESVEPYTEITAAEATYSLGVPTWWPPQHNLIAWVNNPYFGAAGQVTNGGYLSGVYGPGYPIGFNFTFNGDVFDVIGVSHNGWISFGKSADGIQAVWVYASDHPHGMPFVQYIGGPDQPYKRNRVAGFGSSQLRMQDMSPQVPPGPVSSLRIATIGTAPNRTCVIQFKDFRASYSPSTTLINFQIRLNEADNSVEVRYGDVIFGYQSGGLCQVGLGGQLPEDFNSRRTVYEQPAFLYDWNLTAAGQVNTDACTATTEEFAHPNGTGVPPVEGLNWRWDPPVCPPPAWPLAISDVSFDGATASWNAISGGTYEYFLTDTDDVNGTEVASGTTTDATTTFFGLSPATTYYVFIRSICNGEPGVWSLATPFLTMGGGIVECNGNAIEETYCSHQNDTIYWRYVSADGSALRIEFLDGFVGNNSLKAWDGPDASGTPLSMSGDIDGNALNALSGAIFIRLVTDNGSCETQPWYLPVHWRVGCKNCTDPLVNFALGTVDCDNQQFYVDANVFSLGSSTSLSMENSAGLPPTVVSSTGIHSIGPFPAGQSVVVTAQNPDNVMCYAAGSPIINTPCAIEDCGPTEYTHCYGNNESGQWAYQGMGGQEIGIRFLAGTMGLGDDGTVYNGLDIFSSTSVNMTGLLNSLYTSSNTDHALVMELQADNAMSCQDADPLYGTSQPWKWVVACYDGCTQPQASFASTCLSQSQFEVAVNITNVGNTGSVTITNDGGVAPVTANSIGTYTVGPFQAGTPVTLNVEGASVLCTWTSPAQNPDCSTVGIAEQQAGQLLVYPNPSNGTFRLELPKGMTGTTRVQVMDLTGRQVAEAAVQGTGTTLQLQHLPNGLYTVTAQNTNASFTTKISIQH